jgi:hypothetical protein
MRRGSSKCWWWRGVEMCVWKTGWYWISCGGEGISNDHSQAVKIYTETMLLIKALLVFGLHELRVLRKAKRSSVRRAPLWPANNSSHSGVAATTWWTDPKGLMDYNQKACNWAFSIQAKCEQHYRCLRVCKSVCTLGSTKPNRRS